MVTTEQRCKLCMTYIESDNYADEFANLDNDVLKRLEFLQIDLDHDNEESNFLCGQCDENIANIFGFKSFVVTHKESNATNKKIIHTKSTSEISRETVICHLCKSCEGQQCMVSLIKLLEDDGMVNVFQGHLPEVVLKNLDNLMVCKVCQTSLAMFWSLIELWLKARNRKWSNGDMTVKKENFDSDEFPNSIMKSTCAFGVRSENRPNTNEKHEKIQLGTDGTGSISYINVIKKVEVDEELDCSDSVYRPTGILIKDETEESKDIEIDELQLKSEEVEFKDEDELLEDYWNHEDENHMKIFRCYHCSYQTDVKSRLKSHALSHLDSNELQIYKCKNCSFETRYKQSLKKHLLKHRSLDEVQMFKCKECSYETKYKGDLKQHFLKHRSLDEDKMHRCENCSFETRYKHSLKKHLLKHKSLDEIPMFKCTECSYETRHKGSLKLHLLKHKSLVEVQVYKCKECCFETKYRTSLKYHSLKHKSLDEVQMFKCKECSFETRYKADLKKHCIKHKSLDEIQMFRCKECSFETRYKESLNHHILKHKSLFEVQMYNCQACSYKTKWKGNLKKHLLRH